MEAISKRQSIISFSFFIILLLLRFPLLYLGAFRMIPNNIAYDLFLFATYLFTGLFICLNIKNLEKYNFTISAVILFLIAPLFSLIGFSYKLDVYMQITIWGRIALSAGFAIYLIMSRKDMRLLVLDTKKIVSNIILTLALCIAVPVICHAIRGFPVIEHGVGNDSIFLVMIRAWFTQLSFAAVSEEPLFRGFLWGILKDRGLNDLWVCIIQVAIFWSGHIYYINTGLNFWIVHPLCAFLLGFVIWKTKSIAYSMALHASINAFTDCLRFIRFF